MDKVCVIGCGGIGSFLAQHLDKLIELKQITNKKFNFFDDDIVELKNILYQNFETSDIDSQKTEALSFKFPNLNFSNKRLKFHDLASFNMIILCADNNVIRNEAHEAYKKLGIPFIDARANGKAIGIFSSDTENYLDTIDDSTGSTSCQNPFQIQKKEIEYGNVIVASMLAQCILSHDRTKKLPNDLMITF
jgi:molybdopterin/thiamine biosynthesis adenylyltransferase